MKNVVLMILGFIVDAQGTHSLWDPFPDEEDRDILEGFRSVITPPDLSSDLFSPNALDFFPPESPDLCVEPMIELAEGNIFAEHHCATPLLDTSTAPLSEDQFNTFLGQLSPQEQRPQVPFILPRIAGEGDNITRENTDKTGRKKRASARYKHVTDNPVHKIILESICETHKDIKGKELSELLAPYGIILNKEGAALYLRNKKKGSITYRHVTDNPVHKAILEDICATHKDIKAEDLSKRLAKHGITLNKEEAGLYLRNKKKGSTCYAHVTDNPVHKIILEGICETHKGIQAKDLPKLLAPHGITLSTGGAYNYMSNKKQQPKAPKGLKRLRKNRGDPSIGPNRKYRRLRAK